MQSPAHDYHYQRALAAFALSHWDKASQELKEQLAVTPDNAEALALLAACSINLNKADESLKQAQAAISAAPNSAYAHYVYAFAQASRHQTFEAEIAIEEALRMEPDSATYLIAYADLKPKLSVKAVQLLRQALAIEPNSAPALIKLHERLLDLGHEKEAQEVRATMLRLYPNDANIQAASGWQALQAPGGHKQAVDHFEQAVRLSPNTTTSVEGLIKARYHNNNWLSQVLSKVLKQLSLTRIILLAILNTIGCTIYFVICEFGLHIKASILAICITIAAPILLMVAVVLLDILNNLGFIISLLFNKNELAVMVPKYKPYVLGATAALVYGALALWFSQLRKSNPGALPALPHWLYDDWLSTTPLLAGIMPFVFIVAILMLLAGLTYIVRKHIYRRPASTTYFTCMMAVFWAANILIWFAFKATFGTNKAFTIVQLITMLLLVVIPQSKMCRTYIKNTIKNDMQKKQSFD
ncbi:MAG: hypothetical protein IPI39_19140 [Candidatus Obscuribacter sp.]|nr:hypothetical protein [Candidatus Obscuribacter sp.]